MFKKGDITIRNGLKGGISFKKLEKISMENQVTKFNALNVCSFGAFLVVFVDFHM